MVDFNSISEAHIYKYLWTSFSCITHTVQWYFNCYFISFSYIWDYCNTDFSLFWGLMSLWRTGLLDNLPSDIIQVQGQQRDISPQNSDILLQIKTIIMVISHFIFSKLMITMLVSLLFFPIGYGPVLLGAPKKSAMSIKTEMTAKLCLWIFCL